MKRALCLVLAAGLAPATLAQPAFVTSYPSLELSSDGLTAIGSIYEADLARHYMYTFTLQGGFTRLAGPFTDGVVRSDATASVIGFGSYNEENLNNASGTIIYNTLPGFPHPEDTSIGHCWTAATGLVNLGPAPNGNSCDYNINTIYDISRNGRYIAYSGWTNGRCGPYRGQRYDRQTATWSQLPISISPPPASAPSRATRANSISADGSVICGWDDNYESTMTFQRRRAAVWVHNGVSWSETILDPDGGECYGVSGDGDTVVGKDHNNIGVRWVRTGGVWGPTQPMGGGVDQAVFVNYDGSIILGNGWIWKPTLNGGVPMGIAAYVSSLGVSLPNLSVGSPTGAVWGVSDDGNVIGIRCWNASSPCLQFGVSGMVILTGAPCIPPQIGFDPVNVAWSGPPATLGPILNTFAAGSWPLAYQWQKETAPGTWTNLTDDNCGTNNALNFDIQASTTMQLRIGFLSGTWAGRYRCVVTGSCGTAISAVSTVGAPPPPCYPNCDNSTLAPTLNVQDFSCFLNSFANGETYANCDGSTIAPVLNVQDFGCFLNAFATGCS